MSNIYFYRMLPCTPFISIISTSALLVLYCVAAAQPQRKITLSGIVSSGSPVEWADCFLKNNEYLGTVTDTTGYFHLTIPQALLSDTLVIWALGFAKKEVPLNAIYLYGDTVHFHLDEQAVLLNEILIESDGPDLKEVVLKAVENLPKNTPSKRHQLSGLYRKLSTKDTRFTHLEEAAILVEDVGYHLPPALARIRTIHYRQSKDRGDIDSAFVSAAERMRQTITRQLNITTSPLNRLYESNFIRLYNRENSWFDLATMRRNIGDRFKFKLIEVYLDGRDTLYHVAFAASPIPPSPRHVSGRNYLKINMSDFAIVEMQFTLGLDDGPLFSQIHARFEKRGNKYFPTYIRNIHPRPINHDFHDGEYDIYSVWFDEVALEGFKRLSHSEANNPDDPKGHQRPGYSPSFWSRSSLILKHPLEQNVQENLQEHEPLEMQFGEMGRLH